MIPQDYAERVYAGVLGKIIGVYLGRPFEGWTHERIIRELGEIRYYVHDRFGLPLVVTDDDIAGTFTFLRALPDYGNRRDISAAQIGQTWLNYLVEKKTILWWGGRGNSTEHTAYLNLKQGIPAPLSGAIATNGAIVAQQIGAQIFIDGWAMVAPGDPELAAELAGRAGSVSHDGEAVYAAQLWAAMEAEAFEHADLSHLLDTGLRLIPSGSTIYRLVSDLREWRQAEPDWRKTRERIAREYGYASFPGVCHIVPNHALMHLALLYGDDDFQRSLTIVNTSGWDTDCNSGNVGCLLGIKNGLAGLEGGPDWRGPVADRLYLPSADGGRAISDAARETFEVVNVGRSLAGMRPVRPKEGARYHFDLPGAVQGFEVDQDAGNQGSILIENVSGHSRLGSHSLAIRCRSLLEGKTARVSACTFLNEAGLDLGHYQLVASPALYPGQQIEAEVEADPQNPGPVGGNLFIRYFGDGDRLEVCTGPEVQFGPGDRHRLEWTVPDLGGCPVQSVGIEIRGEGGGHGTLYLDFLSWAGSPRLSLGHPKGGGTTWRQAWVSSVDHWDPYWPEAYRLTQDEGVGMIIQGAREWGETQIQASLLAYLARSYGVAARVQGLRRYYALLLTRDGKAQMVKALDGTRVLAETGFPVAYNTRYQLALKVEGSRLQGWVDGSLLFDLEDRDQPLTSGAAGLVIEEGTLLCNRVEIS